MKKLRIVKRERWYVPQFWWLWSWNDFGGEHGPTEFSEFQDAFKFIERFKNEPTERIVWSDK
jgi:hypothetical protein